MTETVAAQKDSLIESQTVHGRLNNKIDELLNDKKDLSEKLITAEGLSSKYQKKVKQLEQAATAKEWENEKFKWSANKVEMEVQVQELLNRPNDNTATKQQVRVDLIDSNL